MLSNDQTIARVVAARLCTTCGGCLGICPEGSIRYEETIGGHLLPVIDEETCTNCGLCLAICPGIRFGPSLFSRLPSDPFVGHSLESYAGRAANEQLFNNSQSGGIVSALLQNALASGVITGAATVAMESGTPPRPTLLIARNFQDIFHAQKSKYSPVPLLGFLKDCEEGNDRIAVVGVSCQIHGLYNILDQIPNLRNRIAFTIGLICDRALTCAAIDYLIAKSGIRKGRVNIHFRDKSVSGYPGDVHVFNDMGRSSVMPSAVRIQAKDFFTPARCRICFDKMNVFSDLTVGDPHGIGDTNRDEGESVLVVRTELGRSIAQDARTKKAVEVRPLPYEQVCSGQMINFKRELWSSFVGAWQAGRRELPDYCELVASFAPVPTQSNRYSKELDFSFRLDKFQSRNEMNRYVERLLKKRQLIGLALYPWRLLMRIAHKIRSRLISSRKPTAE